MQFSGRSVVKIALFGSLMGASLALLIQTTVRNTPVVVNPRAFFWWFVLLSAAGALAGLALESVRQLQEGSTDPAYRRQSRRRRRTLSGGSGVAGTREDQGDDGPAST